MDFLPEKCGIQVKPPAFIVIYRSCGQLRKKTMPLRSFKIDSNINFVANHIKKRHNLDGFPIFKIEKMLRLLQELLKGVDKKTALEKVDDEFSIKTDLDLNKLSTREIDVQKNMMENLFNKNQVKQSDPEFVYDKQVDFSEKQEETVWDHDSDDFWKTDET